MVTVDQPLKSERRTSMFIVVLFCAALGFHVWAASVGWMNLNLPGCEFRQTQTAISAFYIQKDHDFSLAYPTPVLGKPWSIPMEFPLYEWAVVGVSNGTGWSLTSSARAVSLLCFYLALPAFYLLLGRLGLSPWRRLLVLGLILTCPLYIFYARAFLIETMAFMCGGWFLLAYVRAIEERSFSWLLVAIIAGTACGLGKVTSFLFYLIPAFLWTLRWFWQDWHRLKGEKWRALRSRFLWCAGAVAVSFAASIWWVHYSDAVKGESVTGRFLRSGPMAPYHFGSGVRFSAEIWNQHWQIIFHFITSGVVLAACVVLALFYARKWWAMLLALVSMFFAVQLVFPVLYAWHEYYYVANTVTLMVAFGLVLCALFDSRLSRPVVWLLVLGVYGLQARSYLENYYTDQKRFSPGGTQLTLALKRVTAPNEVLVIAGNDWSSITPYFSQRRALMIRSRLEKNWDIINPAFQALKGESVTALVLVGDQRDNRTLRELATAYFNIDPRPAFESTGSQVYLHKDIWASAGPLLKDIPYVRLLEVKPDEPDPQLRHEILTADALPRYQILLDSISPRPFKYYTNYGLSTLSYDGKDFLNAHPDTRFWFKINAGKHHFSMDADMVSGAYDQKLSEGDRSDGVEFTLREDVAGPHPLFSRRLNPRDNPADRGIQHLDFDFELLRDATVVLDVGPGPDENFTRDWILVRGITIR